MPALVCGLSDKLSLYFCLDSPAFIRDDIFVRHEAKYHERRPPELYSCQRRPRLPHPETGHLQASRTSVHSPTRRYHRRARPCPIQACATPGVPDVDGQQSKCWRGEEIGDARAK